MSIWNRTKYECIVESNLEDGDTIEKWQQRNLERMQNLKQ